MKRAVHPANLAAGVIAASAVGWLALVAVSNGALNGLMVLHRDSPQPVSAAQTAPGQAEAGPPRASRAPASASAGTGDFALVIPVSGIRPEQLTDTFSQARANGVRRHDAIELASALVV